MPTCFVIQPFDSGKFDKRFAEICKPALKAAGHKNKKPESNELDQDIPF